MKLGLDILKIVTNPAGFVTDQVIERIVERDESGKELPEVHAFQIKLDRIASLLSFIAVRMDPEGYERVFGAIGGTPQPEPAQQEQEAGEDTQEDEEWL
ncbi:MAG: hypothetical protein F4Y39_24810 [Gemmatimonadetes bacterium]|nr:hypothetical protein [Gemmatimonadota bacterium]MYF79170.1 hypothetical protein [Chloroflexota bacterium]